VYRKVEQAPSSAEDFELSNGCKLAAENRWVILAQLIPWAEFEQEYAQNFEPEVGPPAKSFRLALGALIIKEKLGNSDRETVEQIRENPYLQYFIGQSSYSNEIPFDPSLLVHFRQRISAELVNQVNREVVRRLREAVRSDGEKKNQEEESEPPKNQGKLILDATCAPADISYPTNLKLLNQARVYTEKIIDVLYEALKEKIKPKPRTYRKIARPESVHVDKIYRTRENRAWCKERGIRISGSPLGRPPAHISPEQKKQALKDEEVRNSIEGKFGQGKRRFSLDRVMAKLTNTSETAIAITFLVMNLSTALTKLTLSFKRNCSGFCTTM
jgi:hypothetical protein